MAESSSEASAIKRVDIDDEQSQSSISAVLSDLDEEDDEATSSLERLEKDFALRDKLFDKIAAEKDPDFVRIAKEYEATMRNLLVRHYEAQPNDGEPPVNSGLGRISQSHFFGEALTGYATILLYCVAHLSCWEVLTAIVYECTRNFGNQTSLHFILLVTSLMVLRMSGGIFAWVDPETYKRAQLDLEHRLKLGAWDAHVIQWFRRHELLRTFVNMAGFYVCWIAVAYFETCCLRFLDKRHMLLKGLPSANHVLVTSAREKISSFTHRLGRELLEECVDDACDMEDELEYEDHAYLTSELSIASYYQLMGDESAPLVSTWAAILFYTTAATVSITLLRVKLGHTFGK